jgi:hypothetical protein
VAGQPQEAHSVPIVFGPKPEGKDLGPFPAGRSFPRGTAGRRLTPYRQPRRVLLAPSHQGSTLGVRGVTRREALLPICHRSMRARNRLRVARLVAGLGDLGEA